MRSRSLWRLPSSSEEDRAVAQRTAQEAVHGVLRRAEGKLERP